MMIPIKPFELRLVLKVVSTLPLMLLWHVVHWRTPQVVLFWDYFGVDVTKKYDLFLFAERTQYLHWYVHYTAYYYTLIIVVSCLLTLSRKYLSKTVYNVIFIFYLFCIFRLVEYWLFRFHLGFTLLIGGLILYSLFFIQQKWRKS